MTESFKPTLIITQKLLPPNEPHLTVDEKKMFNFLKDPLKMEPKNINKLTIKITNKTNPPAYDKWRKVIHLNIGSYAKKITKGKETPDQANQEIFKDFAHEAKHAADLSSSLGDLFYLSHLATCLASTYLTYQSLIKYYDFVSKNAGWPKDPAVLLLVGIASVIMGVEILPQFISPLEVRARIFQKKVTKDRVLSFIQFNH